MFLKCFMLKHLQKCFRAVDFPQLKTFLQIFTLHITTSKNVLAAVKILQNIFSSLVLVARYS